VRKQTLFGKLQYAGVANGVYVKDKIRKTVEAQTTDSLLSHTHPLYWIVKLMKSYRSMLKSDLWTGKVT
jgi:hypothetical protein